MPRTYFKKVYDADSKNQSVQTWDVYWNWASVPLRDWDDLSISSTTRLNPKDRPAVVRRIQEIGKRAIGESAKDNRVRAFGEGPLKKYAMAIRNAALVDMGDGKAILATLDQVELLLNEMILKRGLPVV